MKRSVKIENITPKMAEQYLTHLNENRKLRDRNIRWLADQNKIGDWHLTNDAVTFDKNGDLRNGQHRLHAIIQSGIAAELIVFRGADPQAFIHMDSGSSRSAGDALEIMGYPHGRKAETAIRMISAIDDLENSDSQAVSRLRWNKMTHTQIADFAQKNEKNILDAIYFITDDLEITRLFGCSASFYMAMYFVIAERNKTRARAFFKDLANVDLWETRAKSDPVYQLQAKFEKLEASKKHTSSQYKAIMLINAWNAFINGVEPSFNIGKSTKWPKIESKKTTKAKAIVPKNKKKKRSKAA